jgi:hypothetical protein
MVMSSDVTSQRHDRGQPDLGDREYLWFALLLLIVLMSLAGH